MYKRKAYEEALQMAVGVLDQNDYLDDVGRMAWVCAILKKQFPHWIFVGFYRVTQPGVLEIGPYQGEVLACGKIEFGRGVCGQAAASKKTIIVSNIHKIENYITCDKRTQSEIVVPVIRDREVTAVLDVDGPTIGSFNNIDKRYLESIVQYL